MASKIFICFVIFYNRNNFLNFLIKTLLFCLRWIDRSGRLSNYKMKIIWIYKKKMFSRRIHCILQEGWKLG